MSNLEKLSLNLIVTVKNTFINGNELKQNIINHMPRLNIFTFNIRSYSHFYNEINLPSNEDIQKTFKDKKIISYVDYFPETKI